MKQILFLFMAMPLFVALNASAQQVSVIGGITADCIFRSKLQDIDHTILSEPGFLQNSYERSSVPVTRYSFGGFINVLFENGLSVNFDLAYAEQWGRMNFRNIPNNWHYRMDFKYSYINILPALRFYPFGSYQRCSQSQTPSELKKGFYASLGMQFGIQLQPEGITYESGGPGYLTAFGSDQEQENQLNTVLKGRTNIGIVPGLGFEFYNPVPFSINVKYHHGISDVVKTLPNSYNFVNDNNTNNFFQFGLAFFIGRSNRWTNNAKGFSY